MRLSPLCTSDTIWTIVPAPDGGWWVSSSRWNDWQRKPKYSKETWLSATLSTVNLTLHYPGSTPSRRDGKPPTNRMGYSMIFLLIYTIVYSGESQSIFRRNIVSVFTSKSKPSNKLAETNGCTEDEGGMIFRNFTWFSLDYTTLYFRRYNSLAVTFVRVRPFKGTNVTQVFARLKYCKSVITRIS
jgi:hypothetical protein